MERQNENNIFWYAVRTFYCKEESVARYLEKHKIEYFIPSIYKIIVTPDGKKQKKLVPAIHNLLFVKKTGEEEEIKKVNAKNVSYKAVAKVKIREVEFEKNTSRKIMRFKIDKTF